MKLNFQTILLAIFAIGAIIGVAVLATFSGGMGGSSSGVSGEIMIWGTLPRQSFEQIARGPMAVYDSLTIRYEAIDPETFDEQLTEALASGQGPDLFFLPDDRLIMHSNKVFIIPYENYPRDVIINNYIDQAQILFHPEGVLGFPLMIDPMVMYMNRDLMSSSFILNPPQYWDELLTLAPQVTQTTQTGGIQRSFVALGTPSNIRNFQEVFSLIMMQSGNSLVARDNDQELISTFRNNNIADSVIRYMLAFTNPSQTSYSWNATQPLDREAFIREDLAIYFGYASEFQHIRNQNPNLNFSVHLMPQTRDRSTRMTTGRLTALGISRTTQNFNAAFLVATQLSQPEYGQYIEQQLLLPPVQRSLLSQNQSDPVWQIFYQSAIISRGWLNPRPSRVPQLFDDMMRDISAGRARIGDAVNRISAQIEDLL